MLHSYTSMLNRLNTLAYVLFGVACLLALIVVASTGFKNVPLTIGRSDVAAKYDRAASVESPALLTLDAFFACPSCIPHSYIRGRNSCLSPPGLFGRRRRPVLGDGKQNAGREQCPRAKDGW